MVENFSPEKNNLPPISKQKNEKKLKRYYYKSLSVQEDYPFEESYENITKGGSDGTRALSSFSNSVDIPKISYSSFKKNTRARKERRNSNADAILSNLKKINNQKAKVSDITQVVSMMNKKKFKRIEPHEIEYPAKSFGEILIRVHKLVLDPLRSEKS